MVSALPGLGGGVGGTVINDSSQWVTRFVTRTAVLNVVKNVVPDAYIKDNQIIVPVMPEGHQEGDLYAIRLFTTPSYKES